MTDAVHALLRDHFRAEPEAEPVRRRYEDATEALSRGDAAHAVEALNDGARQAREAFGEAHPIVHLMSFVAADALAQAERADEAAKALGKTLNAVAFAITGALPQGDPDQAELLYRLLESAVTTPRFEPALTRLDHEGDAMKTLSNLASQLLSSQPVQAYHLLAAVFRTREKTRGYEDEATLLAGHKLAAAALALGETEAARLLSLTVAEQRRKLYGFEHPLTLRAASLHAQALFQCGLPHEAVTLQEAIHEACLRALGPDAQQTQIAQGNLEEMRRRG